MKLSTLIAIFIATFICFILIIVKFGMPIGPGTLCFCVASGFGIACGKFLFAGREVHAFAIMKEGKHYEVQWLHAVPHKDQACLQTIYMRLQHKDEIISCYVHLFRATEGLVQTIKVGDTVYLEYVLPLLNGGGGLRLNVLQETANAGDVLRFSSGFPVAAF